MTSEATPDTEIALACGQQRALVSPWGAALRRYYLLDGNGGGFTYSSVTDFLERMVVMLDGQMMYNGASAPLLPNDPTDVYPGSSNSMIRFSYALKRGSRIQVVRL